jgi:hypothetical protein
MGMSRPRESRTSGVVARSGVSRTLSASQPLGHAMPRFTADSGSGVRFTASPCCKWMLRLQPVEQKPQTVVLVASGTKWRGTCPRPNLPGARSKPAVSGPDHWCSNALPRRRGCVVEASSGFSITCITCWPLPASLPLPMPRRTNTAPGIRQLAA